MPSSISHDDAARSVDSAAVEKSAIEWLRTELEDPEITASDNFLDVGGHSLVFAQLNRFLADSFGVGLDMRVTYQEPLSTAAAQAQPVRTPA
ncbi:acyl carrier protein [Streptomyces sp. NPDC056255]|uniref:acyl carrier protein n=1 Tax=Streptomyces sp. NPDC056255 TaxID=3345764 RepID=UPI0035D794B9